MRSVIQVLAADTCVHTGDHAMHTPRCFRFDRRSFPVCFTVLLVGLVAATIPAAHARLTAPRIHRVYGGMARTIEAIPSPADTNLTRVFVSVEGPHAVFYADFDPATTNPSAMFTDFEVVPDLSAGDGNFSWMSHIAVHEASGRLYAANEDEGLFSCTTSSGSITTDLVGEITFVLIQGSNLFALGTPGFGAPELYFGTLDGSGVFTEDANSPLAGDFPTNPDMAVSPDNDYVYILNISDPTNVIRSSDTFDTFNASTTFTNITVPTELDAWEGEPRIGFGPDGRLFIGGATNGFDLTVAFTDDDGASWTIADTPAEQAGVSEGINVLTVGTAGDYDVYYGTACSTNRGETNTWIQLPNGGGSETHVNAGCTEVDPHNEDIFYLSTDQGIGASTNGFADTFEIDEGLRAIHIYDIELSADKQRGWLASKSGAWYTTNFPTFAPWTKSAFLDGYANTCGMDPESTTNEVAFVGSRRVWRTTDGGANWTQVYTALTDDGASDGIPDGYLSALEVRGTNVYAGYHGYEQTNAYGRFIVSTNGGDDWAVAGYNMDITDVLALNEDGTGVVYVAMDASPTGTCEGIFKFEGGALSQVYATSLDVTSIDADPTGGVYAATIDGSMDIRVLFKAADSTTWGFLTTNGLPPYQSLRSWQYRGPALTVGQDLFSNDVVHLSIGHSIWYLPPPYTNWTTRPVLQYAQGVHIDALIWDDLAVCTDVGLLTHDNDYDEDGLSDREEQETYLTDPDDEDSDGDGLEDGEEVNDYGTSPTDADSDDDGMTDGAEVQAGTDPGEESSLLEAWADEDETPDPDAPVIRWYSVDGKKYALMRSTNLVDSSGETLESAIEATAPVNVYTDRTATSDSPYYYRVRLDPGD